MRKSGPGRHLAGNKGYALPRLALAAVLTAPGLASAEQAPPPRVQVAIDPENWETRDAGAAVVNPGAAEEPAPGAIENQLRAAMSEGVVADAFRRRRAYPTIDLANRAIKRGDLDGAIAEYQRYLAQDARHLVIRWRLIQLLQQRHREEEVISNADQILNALPRFGLALVARGQALATAGEPDQAMDDFVHALRLSNLPPSARQQALGGIVNTALATGRLAEADSLLAAEMPGAPGSPVTLGLLAARATLAERAGHPEEAASLWGRIAAQAPAPERRRAILAQAQLMGAAGRTREGLDLLRASSVAALFTAEAKALAATRLRYHRLVSVFAEQLGETDIAAEASAAAAALRAETPKEDGAGHISDRLRAARLQQRKPGASPDAALGLLLDGDGRALERPADTDDATWTDYQLLLADAAQRAGRTDLADSAIGAVPREALAAWQTLARMAEISERMGRPAQAAELWGKAASNAPDPGTRRRALLAEAQLLDSAGSTADALRLLDEPATRALFDPDAGATADEQLRYQRNVSVLAERAGQADLARAASDRAAELQGPASGRAISTQALIDQLRAVRLNAGGDAAASLARLLDRDGKPFARPDGADDALWTEYALLLGETARRANKPAIVRDALATTPPSAARDWRMAARLGELALGAGNPALALKLLRPWNAAALAAAGADRTATLAVLTLRANAAAAQYDRATEGVSSAEIASIDPRIGNPSDRVQRLLAAHDPRAALSLLEAARPVLAARMASAPPAERPQAQHQLAQLLVAVAQASWQAGRSDHALQALRDSLAIEESWPIRFQLADALRRAGQRREAAAGYRQAALTAPSKADAQRAWLTLGDLLYADHADTAALDAFRSAVAAGSGKAGQLRLAEVADRLGRYGDEARALKPIADDRATRERLCQVLIKAGERDDASACLDQLVRMADNDSTAWRVAADVAGALGRDSDRTRYLKTAFSLSPRPDLGMAAGDSLMAAGRPAEAASVFETVATQAGDPRAAVARGEALMAANQPAAAAQALRAALATPNLPKPLQARAYATLGYAQSADGDPASAAESWRRARQLGAGAGLAVAEAEALLRAGLPKKAAAVLAEAKASGPSSGLPRGQRQALEVRLALANGDIATARAGAEALARAEPTPAHLSLLAQVRLAAGDKAGAVTASEQAAAAAPKDAQVLAQAGYADLAAGRPAAAAKLFEAALAQDSSRAGLYQDLPRAYALAGDWPDARRAYAEAIRRTASHAAASGDPRDRITLQELQGENAAATDEFAFELVDTLCAPSNAVGCGLSLPLVQRLGSAGIGAATAGWSPHLPGDPDPQRVTFYARLLWSNDPGGYQILSRTLQGGVGVRVQPINGIPVYLWAERLFAIGSQSQDNWLLRATAGWETGAGFRASGTRDWTRDWKPYLFVYGDLGHFFIRDRDWLGVLEGRIGATHQPFDNVLLVPYVFLRGELDSAVRSTATDVQIGVGINLRMRFLQDLMLGYRLQPEIFVRVSHDISRTGGRTGTRFLLGVISRF